MLLVFFVFPVFIAIEAIFTLGLPWQDVTTDADVASLKVEIPDDNDFLRLLQENAAAGGESETEAATIEEKEEGSNKLMLISNWIYISIFAMVSFAYLSLLPLMKKLRDQYLNENNVRTKHKKLGEYSA